MTIDPIVGINSIRLMNAFSQLCIGLKMTPDYSNETYIDFFQKLQDMPEAEQRKKILEGVMIVPLEENEVLAALQFCRDSNGVPYSKANIKNLSPNDLMQALVSVFMEVVKIRIDSISDDQKKN